MTLTDFLHFLLGDADTIRRLAADPWTLAVGAPLVLSAGLARNYDAHDLRRQWWRLLVPFAASTVAAALLFFVLVLVSRAGAGSLPLGWGILGLFWLTAPFAWLYGLPFERLLSAPAAARARRLTLGVVATARVALMARCVGVLLDCGWLTGLLIVVCFAVPTALFAVAAALQLVRPPEDEAKRRPEPAPAAVAGATRQVVDAMSGVALADLPDHVPVSAPPGLPDLEPPGSAPCGVAVGCLAAALLVLPPLLLPGLIAPPGRRGPGPFTIQPTPPAPDVWAADALAVLFWVPWLLLRQPAQRRRTEFVSRLRSGDVAPVVREMAELGPGAFPPHWDPAAVLARRASAPRMVAAACAAADLPAGSWARASFLGRLRRMVPVWADPFEVWRKQSDRMNEDQLRQLAELHDLLRRVPEGRDILEPYHDYLAELCAYTRERDPARSAILQDMLTLALKRGPAR